MVFTCAISGQPCTEPVASPGGQIYERRLILTKLAENGNTDPFEKERPLTEDQLIALDVSSRVTPPARAPTVSSLLDMLQREHDALLLELFDTRQALEETRRELSQALYQNDAAVRVISRLVMERDGAKAKLATFEQSAGVLHPPVSTNVDSMQVDSSSTAVVEDEVKGEAADKSKSKISDDDMAVMVDTWKKLSKARKKRSPTFPTFEDLSKYTEIDTKSNLHRTNKPGANCLAVIPKSKTIISGGADKTTVIYNTDTETVTATLTGSKGEIICVEANEAFVLTGSADGVARVYHTDKDYELVGSYDLGSPCTGVSIHPTGKYVFLVSKAGRVVFCDDNLTELATFNDDGESEYTCVGMHPDGLILGIGTTDGKLKILDLKSQKFASTLEVRMKWSFMINCVLINNDFTFTGS